MQIFPIFAKICILWVLLICQKVSNFAVRNCADEYPQENILPFSNVIVYVAAGIRRWHRP